MKARLRKINPRRYPLRCTIADGLSGCTLLPHLRARSPNPIPLEEFQMNKIERSVACALFLIAASWIPVQSLAQSPFDGTWRTNMAQTKLSPKPNEFYLSQGWYHCTSCNPKIDAKADGTDQPVTGQSYDTISVRDSDSKSLSFTTQKGGK